MSKSMILYFGVGLLAAVGAVFYFRNKPVPGDAVSDAQKVTAPGVDFLAGIQNGLSDLMTTINFAGGPRGIRNNNPLNIKWVSFQTWNGQVGVDDAGFVIFDKPENGIRAGVRTLTSYRNAGYVTPRQIITRWTGGDSSEIQNSYIAHVSGVLGIAEGAEVPASRWFDLIKVMIKHENGQQPYTDAQIRAGIVSA